MSERLVETYKGCDIWWAAPGSIAAQAVYWSPCVTGFYLTLAAVRAKIDEKLEPPAVDTLIETWMGYQIWRRAVDETYYVLVDSTKTGDFVALYDARDYIETMLKPVPPPPIPPSPPPPAGTWPWPLSEVQDWFEGFWDWVGDAANAAGQWVVNGVQAFFEDLHDSLTGVSQWLNEQLASARDFVVDSVEDLGAWVRPHLEGLASTLTSMGTSLGESLKTWGTDVSKAFSEGVKSLTTNIQEGFSGLDITFKSMGDRVQELNQGLAADSYEGGLNWVQQAIAGVTEKISDGFQAFVTWFWEGAQGLAGVIGGFLGRNVLTPLAGALGDLGEWILALFRQATDGFWSLITKPLGTSAEDAIGRAQRIVTQAAVGFIPLAMASVAGELVHPTKELGLGRLSAVLFEMGGFQRVIRDVVSAMTYVTTILPLRYALFEVSAPMVPREEELLRIAEKRIMDQPSFTATMRKAGFNEYWANLFWGTTWFKPRFQDLQPMMWRGAISPADFVDAMSYNAIPPEWITAYEALIPQIPQSGDIIRFAVREAFTRTELQAEYPAVFGEWMVKQGFSDYWARMYWAAHWVLVPLGQLYDLFHRGLIDRGRLSEMLKYHDYDPEWRDMLIQLSWNLPGAIEARWMFRWGDVNLEGLRDLLVAQGLDPNWADKTARAIAKNQFEVEINKLVENYKGDFIKGFATEVGLRGDLAALEIPGAFIEYHVQDALEDRERMMRTERLRMLSAQYKRGALKMAEVLVEAEKLMPDAAARDLWLQSLPQLGEETAVEETYTTEVNRLVANAKGDYVKGYNKKDQLVSRLQLLKLPDEVVKYQVMDAEEDRRRAFNDKALASIKDAYLKDVITDFDRVEAMAAEYIVDRDALELYLDEVYLAKHSAVRVKASE